MKSYKIVAEIVLAIFLLLVGYFLYQLGMNIRHDVPIIKGLVSENDIEFKDTNKDTNKNQNIYSNIYSVATFTENIRNLQATITYPKDREDILNIIKSDYEKFKLENKYEINDEINATSTNNISGVPSRFSYEVNYVELSTSSEQFDFRSYIFTYYKYVDGSAHGESGMLSYNYLGNEKINSIYDIRMSSSYLNTLPVIQKIKTKSEIYKILHDEAKRQIIKELKTNLNGGNDLNGSNDNNIDMKLRKESLMNWIEEGLSYSATNTSNYDTWWIKGDRDKGDNIYIYIAPYQIGPYAYGDRKVVIPYESLK